MLHGIYLESLMCVWGNLRWGDKWTDPWQPPESLKNERRVPLGEQRSGGTAQISLNASRWFVQRRLFPWTISEPCPGRAEVKASQMCLTGGLTEGIAGLSGLQKEWTMGFKGVPCPRKGKVHRACGGSVWIIKGCVCPRVSFKAIVW